MLRRLRKLVGRVRRKRVSGRFRRSHPQLGALIDKVLARRLTYLSAPALENLAEVMVDVERRGLAGAVVEAGTALGGSAIVLGLAKSESRPLMLYDVFGTIPPPSAGDGVDVRQRYEVIASGRARGIGGDDYYGYRDDLRREVEHNLAAFGIETTKDNIRYVKGLFQETMPVTEPVAVAHIDCDWYESVMTCLNGIAPSMVTGGRFVIDDYDAWSGCRKAVDEFLGSPAGRRFRPEQHARRHLVATG